LRVLFARLRMCRALSMAFCSMPHLRAGDKKYVILTILPSLSCRRLAFSHARMSQKLPPDMVVQRYFFLKSKESMTGNPVLKIYVRPLLKAPYLFSLAVITVLTPEVRW